MASADESLHDFPDRAIRKLLEDPQNLRHLLAEIVPDLVDRFDFERVESLPRTFLLDDWRRREADLLFRLPFRDDAEAPPALVCVLLEHQSEPDPAMPLRVLIYAVLYWQEEWKQWEADHARGEPLRLSPVIPVVFHTGPGPWGTNRTLADLIAAPEVLRAFTPQWAPLFWDLVDRSHGDLVRAAGEWLAALAVVRAEREDAEAFRAIFATVLQRLEGLSESERTRWHDLLWFVLSWALRRRPGAEREALLATARESQAEAAHREEVTRMSETIQQTWEQELLAQGVALGEARGQLLEARHLLQLFLEERFGPLPSALVEKIEQTEDPERLRRALRQAISLTSLADLAL